MATTETNPKAFMHIRSNSLPSAPHPLLSQFEEHLHRLKASEATSSSSLSHKLNDLQDFHGCTNKLLQLQVSQQALAQECCKEWVDEQMEGSVRLLDFCCTAKDALLQSKESLHKLQSVVRRKRGSEIAFTIESSKYLASRKKVKKAILKAFGNLKRIKFASNKDNEASSVMSILRETKEVTITSLESLMLFISGPKEQSKQNKWSVVSKLLRPKRVASHSEELETNEFEKVDAELQTLIYHKPCNVMSIENFQTHMEELESCIDYLEEGLDHLHRQLIRTRVSLLNILHD